MTKFSIKNMINVNKQEIAKTFNYKISIPNLGNLVEGYDDQIFSLSLIDCTLPSRTNESIVSEYMGNQQRFSGKTNFAGTITATTEVREDIEQIRVLYDWMESIHSLQTGNAIGSNKSDYTTDTYIILYKNDGNESPLKYRLYNSWISDITEFSLSYSTGDSIKISFTVSFDYWELV